jgi:hypothetical protein
MKYLKSHKEFLDWLRNYQPLNNDSASWSYALVFFIYIYKGKAVPLHAMEALGGEEV